MFLSEPICVLKAGHTVDGRVIEQNIIDEIAATYNPKKFTARCNEDHFSWGTKLGSVMRVEARDDELWAVVKPNSRLLQRLEQGQLLHTSVEFQLNFANTGKAYLTGLAFTDNPASLGTTQVTLSSNESGKQFLASEGMTLSPEQFSVDVSDDDDMSLFKKFINFIKRDNAPAALSITPSQDLSEIEMEELKQLLAQQAQLMAQQAQSITALTAKVDELSNQNPTPTVEALSAKVDDLTQKLSRMPADAPNDRVLAGEIAGTNIDDYLS